MSTRPAALACGQYWTGASIFRIPAVIAIGVSMFLMLVKTIDALRATADLEAICAAAAGIAVGVYLLQSSKVDRVIVDEKGVSVPGLDVRYTFQDLEDVSFGPGLVNASVLRFRAPDRHFSFVPNVGSWTGRDVQIMIRGDPS